MDVVIRADASIHIGSGHVMRCLVLAHALKQQGSHVSFACRRQSGDLVKYIQEQGFLVYELVQPDLWKTPSDTADYQSWLQVSNSDDAESFLSLVERVDLLIVDHYGIDISWEIKVKEKLKCKLLVIDDLNRVHCCDLILDQNLWPDNADRYCESTVNDLLIGPDFALLRPLFNKLSNHQVKKENTVIVFFGGSDPTAECLKVAKALKKFNSLPFKVQLITGKSNPSFNELISLAPLEFLEIKKFISRFEEALAKAKYVIGASGVSNWERFCLNIPASVVCVAENQRLLSEYLSELGLINYLGLGSETRSGTYEQEIKRIAANWTNLHQENRLDLDGLGVNRAVNKINKIMG